MSINYDDIQRVTPFISPIRLQGGTMYVFNSAAEDLTFSFNQDSNRKFKFSKFALLNLPQIKNSAIENTIKLDAIAGAYNSVRLDNINNYNTLFSTSFQNYCLNLESGLVGKSTYDSTLPRTVSERVFFKWLKELGAIRFLKTQLTSSDASPRYIEERESNTYHRVVKYVGEIDYINNFSGAANTYSEVYVHIPTEVGDFSDVYFSSVSDTNYTHGMSIGRNTDDLNSEVLMGRTYDDVHPYGLDITAYYDNPSGLNGIGDDTLTQLKYYKKIVGRTNSQNDESDYILNDWWYPPTASKNCYYTEISNFLDADNDDLALYKETGSTSNTSFETGATRYRRSRLDGISLDFDVSTYSQANSKISSLIDVARSDASKDFEFNCILVYYDIYTRETTSAIIDYDVYENPIYGEGENTNILSTNLFGVLFLDNVETGESLSGGKIPTFKKCRPNSVLNLNGNAYGFKINLKLDVSPNDSTVKVETVISNSNTLSMDIYADALNEMSRISSIIAANSLDVLELESRFYGIEKNAQMFNSENNRSLVSRITALEQTLTNETTAISDAIKNKSDILNLLERNNTILTNILNGTIDSPLAINLDFLQAGQGVKIDKINDKLKISSNAQNYVYGDTVNCSILSDWTDTTSFFTYEVPLMQGRNYLRISDSDYYPRKNLKLFIKDYNVSWETGQIFRLYFENPVKLRNSFGNFIFSIYTDAKNLMGASNAFSANVVTMDASKFESFNNRPIMEIHCIDSKKLKFLVDYL